MISLLLSNIRSIASIAAILAVFGAGWYVRGMKADIDQQAALQAQEVALVAKCNADKELTRKAGEEYEAKISTLNSRVSSLKRLQSTKCVSVARAADTVNGSAAGGLPNTNGIPAGELVDYAGDAEKVRQQLISLQEFVRKAGKQ